MKYRYLLVLLLLLVPIMPVMAAVYPENFTPIINYIDTNSTYGRPSAEFIHYNSTHTWGREDATPFDFWLFMAIVGLVLFVLSFVLVGEPAQLISLITPLPLIITAWQSLAIDRVTAFGMSSQPEWLGAVSSAQQKSAIPNVNEYILLEQHTINSQVLISIFFAILFIVAILNIYRLYVKAKTIEEDEEMVRRPRTLD